MRFLHIFLVFLLSLVPVASAGSTTNLSENTTLSIVAPYIGEYVYNSPGSGTGNFYGLNYGTCTRVRQNGQIVGAQFALSNTVDLSRFQICVWRQNDTTENFTLISKSEDVSGYISGDGIQNVIFSSPLNALEGDFIGWECNASSFTQTTSASIGSTTDSKIYYGSDVYEPHIFNEEDEFDWIDDAPASTSNKTFRIGVFMNAVEFAFIGDSVVSGRPVHTSYVDPALYYQPNSSMAYQWGLLSGKSYQNLGWRGQSTTQIRDRFIADAINIHPNYLFIEGGLNDQAVSIPANTTYENMCWMVNTSYNAGIHTYLCEIPPSTNYGVIGDWTDWDTINSQFHTLYDGNDSITIIPIREYVGKYYASGPDGNLWTIIPKYDPGDGLHYNVEGYEKFARVIYDEYARQSFNTINWTSNFKITINHEYVISDQTDYPLYINISSEYLADKAQPDADDLVFTLQNGTVLPHEFEGEYNSTDGSIGVFVKVPAVSSTTDTVLYCYVSNPSVGNNENITNVWAPHYVGVWHLDEADYVFDSTEYNNDGTNTGATLNIGQDYGLDFNGSVYININNAKTDFDLGSDESYTIISIYNISGLGVGTAGGIFATGDRSTGVGYDIVDYNGTSDNRVYARSDNSSSQTETAYTYTQSSNKVFVASVFNITNSTQELYLNGEMVDYDNSLNLSAFGGLTPNPHNVYIGKYYIGSSRYHVGTIYEVWFINESLSAADIETIYNNLMTPQLFVTIENPNTSSLTDINNIVAAGGFAAVTFAVISFWNRRRSR